MKNPAYGRHQLFWPMRIEEPIQMEGEAFKLFISLPAAVAATAEGLLGKKKEKKEKYLFLF